MSETFVNPYKMIVGLGAYIESPDFNPTSSSDRLTAKQHNFRDARSTALTR